MRNSLAFMSGLLVALAFTPGIFGQTKEGPWGEKVTARVDGLACPFCAYGVEKKLERMEGVDSLDIRINKGLVILYSRERGKIDESLIGQKVKEAGFTPRGIERESFPWPGTGNDTDSLEKVHLNIRGMTCEYCVLNIESALEKIEGVRSVSVDLENDGVDVNVVRGTVSPDSLIRTIESIGAFEAFLHQ